MAGHRGYGPDRQTPLPPPIDDTVRAPLVYAYTAIDIMAALPRSEAVDVDALPADLQRKARAHGDDLDNIVESEQLTTRHRRDIAWTEIARAGRFVEPIAKYGAPATAGIAVVLMAGHWWRHSGASVVEILAASNPFGYLAIALGAAALLVRFARRRAATAPHWVYTADELATLDAASIDWPAVPEELDRYANGEALRREWHNRWMSRIHPGGAALVWREPHLVAVATLLGRDIRSSPGTASCSTSTASGSTSTKPSMASTHGRTAFGAPAPTSSRRPARTLPTWWPAATPRCLTPPPTRGTPWSPWCASCRTTANPYPGRHDLRRDSRAAAEQPAHHR